MIIRRTWAMPNAETFLIPPISEMLAWRLRECAVVIDPFARNNRFGTITNDLNPETSATHHLDAIEFLDRLIAEKVRADAVLFDPPYSPRQISEIYQNVGRGVTMKDTQMGPMYHAVRDLLARLLKVNGIAVSCGWNSAGFGSGRLFDIEEILLVAHGGMHNDTIVTVERKMQDDLFAGVFGEPELTPA